MSTLTNKYDLPEEVVKALTANRYVADDDGRKTDYSATSLVAPTQQVILKKRYPDCVVGDVVDNLWSMFGSIAHSLLEEHGSDDTLTEKRFYSKFGSKVISGQVDVYKDGVITDYKTTSVYKVQKGSYSEWEAQLNTYAYLVRQHNLPVRNLRVIAILRDWNERDIDKPNYPKAPIVVIPLTLWEEWEQFEWISSRLSYLNLAEILDDAHLPNCSKEECWQSDSKWAITKKGGKRAFRVFNSKEEMEEFNPDDSVFDIQERKGEPRRCLKYCQVATKCHQFKKYQEDIANASD